MEKVFRSFLYAMEGIGFATRDNVNLRIHFVIALLVAICSFFVHLSTTEIGLIGVLIVLVIASEMINTALEEMVNLITNEHRKEAKIAKDVAAGMVLVSSVGAFIIGSLIFIPHILQVLQ